MTPYLGKGINVGVGVLDDPTAQRQFGTVRDVEDAVPYSVVRLKKKGNGTQAVPYDIPLCIQHSAFCIPSRNAMACRYPSSP